MYRQSARRWLPLLSTGPTVTFPAEERHRPSAGTKLYCLVTEAHACEQLAQGTVTWKRTGRDSNPRPFASRANALPLRHTVHKYTVIYLNKLSSTIHILSFPLSVFALAAFLRTLGKLANQAPNARYLLEYDRSGPLF